MSGKAEVDPQTLSYPTVIGISDFPPTGCPPVPGLVCPDEYGIALTNGQEYLNSPNPPLG